MTENSKNIIYSNASIMPNLFNILFQQFIIFQEQKMV